MGTGIHVAVRRTVLPGCEEAFERAIVNFFADSLQSNGTLGVQLIRPIPGSDNHTYGILRTFATEEDRDAFYMSERFAKWQETVAPMVTDDYSRQTLHGLEAFFDNPGLIKRPSKIKMALITWLAVWTTVFVVSTLLMSFISGWPRWLSTGLTTFLVVLILTWGLMPVLTRILRSWLFKP